MKQFFVILVFVVMLGVPALADVAITATIGGKGIGQMASGQTVTYIKGLKMRTETTMLGQMSTTIIDLDNGRSITLDAEKREATIGDWAKMSSALQKAMPSPPKVTFTASGQTKDILGRPCDRYDLTVALPVTMPGGGADAQMTIMMAGPVWVAKGAPGSADYARFQKAATAKGGLLSDPLSASPSQASAMAELYKWLAGANGIAYSMELGMKIQGSGPMADLFSKMGGDTAMSMNVTNVATTPLADELFTVPAGYKTK